MATETIDLKITLNGAPVERQGARSDMLLIDFLHEELGQTGTKFSCGIGACSACKVAARENDEEPLIPILACFARLKSINGLQLTTVEGLADHGRLHPLQHAFLEDHAFQCGFSTPGFLMAGYILLDQLAHQPIARERLDDVIMEAINAHICRCTGYLRYVNSIRRVILEKADNAPADRPLLLARPAAEFDAHHQNVSFRISKKSGNDLAFKPVYGEFRSPRAELSFERPMDLDSASGFIEIDTKNLLTGIRVRDFNLRKFFFTAGSKLRCELAGARYHDNRWRLDTVGLGKRVPLTMRGTVSYGENSLEVEAKIAMAVVAEGKIHAATMAPVTIDPRALGFSIDSFAVEFGLKIRTRLHLSFDVVFDGV